MPYGDRQEMRFILTWSIMERIAKMNIFLSEKSSLIFRVDFQKNLVQLKTILLHIASEHEFVW